jgi:hypothetical protein
MPEPPAIIRYRNRQSRVVNANRRNINEYGLTIPSRNSYNYEPTIDNGVNLLSATYNYKKVARQRRNNAWANYTRRRAAAARSKNGNKGNNGKNGTRKSLFGNNGNNGTRKSLFGNRNNGNATRRNLGAA